MESRKRIALTVALGSLAALTACGSGGGERPAAAGARFDAERAFRDLRAQVKLGPRPSGSAANRRLVRLLAARLRDAGVREVRVQAPERNVVARLPGRRPGAIVVGAHHDTKDIPGFAGANDGASGVAVVLELARALLRPWRGRTIEFALFDGEESRGDRDFAEDGTRGSRQYVRLARRARDRQGTPPLGHIRAMVLFDMVGDCDLRVPYEASSDRSLYERFRGGAIDGTAGAILDDHIPFREAGVPALDLIDFEFGPGPSPGPWWHTTEDTLDKVCAASLGAVGRAALRALPDL